MSNYINFYKDKKFILEEDIPELGYYLYIFKNEECIFDYLVFTKEQGMLLAFEDFEVPLETWQEMQ